jgi:hypothetical protein
MAVAAIEPSEQLLLYFDAFVLWLQCSTMQRPFESKKPLHCLLPPKCLCVAGSLQDALRFRVKDA